MINLNVDEAYAFDFLTILYLKKEKNKEYLKTWKECSAYIKKQMPKIFNKIIKSKEYQNLLEANSKTFAAVDKAKNDLVKASYVDQCNYERYLAKRDLQNKFFNTKLAEVKIGYDK